MTGLPWKTLFSQDKFWCSAPTVPSPLQRWQRSHTSLIPCSPKFPVVSAPTGVEFWPQQSLLVAVWKVQLDTKGITERFGLERNLKFIYFQPPAMDSFHYLPGCSDLHPTWPWRDRFSLDIEKFCSLILSKPRHRKKPLISLKSVSYWPSLGWGLGGISPGNTKHLWVAEHFSHGEASEFLGFPPPPSLGSSLSL